MGDAAILLGEVRALRAAFGPEVELLVSEQRPDVARREYPHLTFVPPLHPWRPPRRGPRWATSLRRRRIAIAVRLMWWSRGLARLLLSSAERAYVNVIATCDAVISTGGTYLVEHYNFGPKVDEILLAGALGRPVFLYTQSLGPFTRQASVARMRRVAKACTHIFVRDERSARHLREIGIADDRFSVHADAAFALAEPTAGAGSPEAAPRTGASRPARVAVSVRRWTLARMSPDQPHRSPAEAEAAYRVAIADGVRTLATGGHEVVFLSTCQGLPEFSDDSRYAQGIVDEFLAGEARIRVDSRFRTPPDLIGELRNFDLAIATRMHFLILSLVAGLPAIAIAYEFKSRELMAALGFDEHATDYETVTGRWMASQAELVIGRATELRRSVAREVERLRSSAHAPAVRIRRELERTPSALRAT